MRVESDLMILDVPVTEQPQSLRVETNDDTSVDSFDSHVPLPLEQQKLSTEQARNFTETWWSRGCDRVADAPVVRFPPATSAVCSDEYQLRFHRAREEMFELLYVPSCVSMMIVEGLSIQYKSRNSHQLCSLLFFQYTCTEKIDYKRNVEAVMIPSPTRILLPIHRLLIPPLLVIRIISNKQPRLWSIYYISNVNVTLKSIKIGVHWMQGYGGS